MKRTAVLYSAVLFILVSLGVALGQTPVRSRAKATAPKPCPFSITGLWRSDETGQTNILFDFSPKGWVVLLGHSSDSLPQDYEMIASVNYRLSTPASPKRIEFTATKGNEIFPPGTTALDIIEYNDDTFTTVNPQFAVQTRWVREQTHRYFLTLAGPSNVSPTVPVFAMWTTLDGRETRVDALGVQIAVDAEGKPQTVFGVIPPEAYEQLIRDIEDDTKPGQENRDGSKKKDKDTIIRVELTPAEFERSHAVLQKWDNNAKSRSLPHAADAYANGLEFLRQTIGSLNSCSNKLDTAETNRNNPAESQPADLGRRAVEYIRMIRTRNESLHIPIAAFPWGWRPSVQLADR